MDVLVDFARSGRIGPLHCGMPLAEAEDLLGPGRPHPAILMKGPDIDDYPYSWSGLELYVTKRVVSGLWINLGHSPTVKLPSLVLPGSTSFEATVAREDLLAALDAADCEYRVNDILTFGSQSSILTRPANVCAVFTRPGPKDRVPDHGRQYLRAIHKRPD